MVSIDNKMENTRAVSYRQLTEAEANRIEWCYSTIDEIIKKVQQLTIKEAAEAKTADEKELKEL